MIPLNPRRGNTANGTSTTSPGNVYLGSLPGYDSSGNYYGGPNATTIPDNQLWVIEEVNPTRTIADGVYTIKNMASQKMMDATSAGNVVSWGSHGGNNQKWKVTYHNDGFYTLRPMSDLTKALDVESNYDEMGSNIDVWTVGINSTGGDWAKWKIIPNATGSGYRITCKAGYYAHAATVLEGSTANGANVMQVEYCNAASQQWIFTPVSVVNATALSLSDSKMIVGEQNSLTLTVTPANATNKEVLWNSSDTNIATVDKNGTVTPKKVGSVTITAINQYNPTLTASCTVTITEKGYSNSIDQICSWVVLEETNGLAIPVAFALPTTFNCWVYLDQVNSASDRRVYQVSTFAKADRNDWNLLYLPPEVMLGNVTIDEHSIEVVPKTIADVLTSPSWIWAGEWGTPYLKVGSSSTFECTATWRFDDATFPFCYVTNTIEF